MVGKMVQAVAPSKVKGINVQSSIYGSVIARGWGTFRASANLLWYGDFRSIAHTSTTSAGGKGGGSQTSTNYTYEASVIIGICQGPIDEIRSVYKDKTTHTNGATTALSQANLSATDGSIGQAPWGYLTTNHPTEAIGYSGICYAYASNYELGESGALGNHSFEIVSLNCFPGKDDANPRDIVEEFLPTVPYWGSGLIGNLDSFGDYCPAAGILLSPVLNTQRTAADFITEILRATNSEAVWSDGVLKIIPYGDTAVTGNGVTWTPDLTPVYDLTDADFIHDPDEDPVLVDIKRPADAWNYIQVEYLDRTHQYNTQVVPAMDQGSIDQFGRRQATSPFGIHSICDPDVATKVAQLLVQRTANVRATFRFRLSWNYILLEPMDLVTLTTGDLDHVLVRITQADEQSNGDIEFEAEEMLVGSAHAADFSRQAVAGYVPNYDVEPGDVTDYALINPPRTLTNGDYEIWAAAAGDRDAWGGCELWGSLDGTEYKRMGVIRAAARLGVMLDTLPLVADPDTSSASRVDLTYSDGELLTATQADVDAAVTLCLIGNELVAYRDSFLTFANQYRLEYFRRGLYETTIASHPPTTTFIRLDETLAHVDYQPEQVGATLYVKFLSFNIYERKLQSLADVSAHSIVLTPGAPPVVDITVSGLSGPGGVLLTWEDVFNELIHLPGKNLFRQVDWSPTGSASAITPAFADSMWGFRFTGGSGDGMVEATPSGYGPASTDMYSYSFEAKLTTGSGSATIHAGWRDSLGNPVTGVADQTFTITTAQQRCVMEAVQSSDPDFATSTFRIWETGTDVPTGQNVDIANLMMEPGSKASFGWRPSPNDENLLRYAGYLGSLNATRNLITISSSTPGSPSVGDIWVDTTVTANPSAKTWDGSSWVLASTVGGIFGSNLYRTAGGVVATLTDFLTASGISAGFTGQTSWATYGGHTPTGVLQNMDANGAFSDWRGFGNPNGAAGMAAVFDVNPLSTDTRYCYIAAFTIKGQNYNRSCSSATVDFGAADTTYGIVMHWAGGYYGAILVSDIDLYVTAGGWLYIGTIVTQVSAGVWSPPPAPDGYMPEYGGMYGGVNIF